MKTNITLKVISIVLSVLLIISTGITALNADASDENGNKSESSVCYEETTGCHTGIQSLRLALSMLFEEN